MHLPRPAHVMRLVVFAVLLLFAAAIREGPSPAVNQAIIWLPTGIAVAGLWILGLRAAWVVAGVTVLQRVLLRYDPGVMLSAAAGSTAEAVLGVLVLRRLGLRASLERTRDAAALLIAAAIAPFGSIVFSWLGRVYLWRDTHMPFYSGWDGWWRMNALGLLTVVPVVLVWRDTPRAERTARLVGGALLAVIAIPALVFVALVSAPAGIIGVMWLNLVVAAVVLFAAVRFAVRGATLAGATAAIATAVLTSYGHGPFLELPFDQRPVAIQLFEFAAVAIPIVLGALLAERRAAEVREVRSDMLRRSLQSAVLDVIYRIRRHDWIVLDMSAPAADMAPFPPERVIGHSALGLLPAERIEAIRTAVTEGLATGRPATVEYELVVGDRRLAREARYVPHGEDEMLAVVRDITARRRAEDAMAFETRVLAAVATGLPRAEVFHEIVDGLERLVPGSRGSIIVLEGTRMRVAYAPSLPAEYNAAVDGLEIGPQVGSCGTAAALGCTVVVRDIATDPLWAPYRDVTSPHGLRACWSVPIRDSAGTVLGTVAVYYGRPRVPDPDDLALAGRAASLAGIVLEREQRGEALRRSEDLLASINRNVREGLFRASPDLRLTDANDALARSFGRPDATALVGMSLAGALVDPTQRDALLARLSEPGARFDDEMRFRRADGTVFWALLTGTAIAGRDGRVAHVDGTLTDVTARKELEEQFRQAQKLEAVGKLAGGVAHDFNNLLTVVIGYADAIRGETGDRPAVRERAERVLEAARRAAALTRQLLAYSRQQVLSPQVLELTSIVDQLARMLRPLIGEHLALVIEHRSGPCWVRVDRTQIEQVLLNLVVNARDAMRAGGTLTITTALDDADGGAAAREDERRETPAVTLTVTDTGAGMPPEVLARAFDPFFTTKPPGEGTGLGLSTVYGIVTQSGGTVALDSQPGRGTSVRIRLPRWAPGAPSAAPEPRVAAAAGAGTVLVVEDEPAVRELVCHTLARRGYRVLEAGDGVRALERARAHEGPLDLVVTDVVMPRMGGRELAARLLAERPGTRFLFISGYPHDVREPADLIGHAGELLAKPFTPEQLLERVAAGTSGAAARA